MSALSVQQDSIILSMLPELAIVCNYCKSAFEKFNYGWSVKCKRDIQERKFNSEVKTMKFSRGKLVSIISSVLWENYYKLFLLEVFILIDIISSLSYLFQCKILSEQIKLWRNFILFFFNSLLLLLFLSWSWEHLYVSLFPILCSN